MRDIVYLILELVVIGIPLAILANNISKLFDTPRKRMIANIACIIIACAGMAGMAVLRFDIPFFDAFDIFSADEPVATPDSDADDAAVTADETSAKADPPNPVIAYFRSVIQFWNGSLPHVSFLEAIAIAGIGFLLCFMSIWVMLLLSECIIFPLMDLLWPNLKDSVIFGFIFYISLLVIGTLSWFCSIYNAYLLIIWLFGIFGW